MERFDESKVTRAHITVYSNDPEAWGVGFELRKQRETIYIASLYVRKDLFPSKRRLTIEYIIPRVLKQIPTKDELIIIMAPTKLFRRKTELKAKFGMYVPNQELKFTEVKRAFPSVIGLAIDSVKRGNSITERMTL
jgi:hypothetical protein